MGRSVSQSVMAISRLDSTTAEGCCAERTSRGTWWSRSSRGRPPQTPANYRPKPANRRKRSTRRQTDTQTKGGGGKQQAQGGGEIWPTTQQTPYVQDNTTLGGRGSNARQKKGGADAFTTQKTPHQQQTRSRFSFLAPVLCASAVEDNTILGGGSNARKKKGDTEAPTTPKTPHHQQTRSSSSFLAPVLCGSAVANNTRGPTQTQDAHETEKKKKEQKNNGMPAGNTHDIFWARSNMRNTTPRDHDGTTMSSGISDSEPHLSPSWVGVTRCLIEYLLEQHTRTKHEKRAFSRPRDRYVYAKSSMAGGSRGHVNARVGFFHHAICFP